MVTSTNKLKFQKTIKDKISISGIGLHTGVSSTITLKPAPENHGIKFKRIDLKGKSVIEGVVENVIDVTRGTTIGNNKFEIHTIEHLMAAISGLHIDNLLIEINNIEVPIMDGSAKPFVDLLIKAKIKEQNSHRVELVIDETITYSDSKNGIDIHVVPSDKFRINYMMDYKHPSIGTQYTSYYSIIEEFIKNVAPARTFCLLSEVNNLIECGLIKGGNLDNSLVFIDKIFNKTEIKELNKKFPFKLNLNNKNTLLNDTDLRYYNEPVRHKLLDLLGDLSLLGIPIKGHVVAARSGHASNIEFIKNIKRKYFKKGIGEKMTKKDSKLSFNIGEVLNILPHRYPFLLIDKILDLKPAKKVKALKNVTINEPFFQGHFTNQPVMPGVLLVEAMAQAGGFLVLNTIPSPETKLMYISAIENTRFKRIVTPGDQLIINAELKKFKLNTCKISAQILVNKDIVAESTFLASVVNRDISL